MTNFKRVHSRVLNNDNDNNDNNNDNNDNNYNNNNNSISLSLYMYIYIYIYIYICFSEHPLGDSAHLRPIFVLRIYNFGIRVKRTLKQKRWVFLAHRLISYRSDFMILTQRFLVWQFIVWQMAVCIIRFVRHPLKQVFVSTLKSTHYMQYLCKLFYMHYY